MSHAHVLSRLLASACLFGLVGCSALPFERNEPEALSSLPSADGVGWQERLARLKEKHASKTVPARENVAGAPAREKVAAAPKQEKKKPLLPDERLASAPQRERRTGRAPAETNFSLGRWVKPAKDRSGMRTFDIEKPVDFEPDVLARTESRSPQKEQPVSYHAPERTAAAEVAPVKKLESLPPIVEQPTYVESSPAAPPPAARLVAESSDSGQPKNRLRTSSAPVSPPASVFDADEVSPAEPALEKSGDSVPWKTAKFRSVDE